MGLGELGHGQDATEEHRLGRGIGERGELGQGPRSVSELPMGERLGDRQLGAQNGHVGDLGGATNAGGHSEGVQRPARQHLTQRSGPLERQATLRIAAQGDLDLSHLVGGIVPALRVRQFPGDSVGGEPAERVLPAGLPQVEHHLSIQRAALDPASADDRRRRPQYVHSAAEGVVRPGPVDPPGQLFDQLHEPTTVDQEMAPGVVDHRFEVVHGDARGERSNRPRDRGLTAGVVEAAVDRREEPQHVSRSIGEQPLIERDDHFVGVLEPSRGAGMQLGQSTR